MRAEQCTRPTPEQVPCYAQGLPEQPGLVVVAVALPGVVTGSFERVRGWHRFRRIRTSAHLCPDLPGHRQEAPTSVRRSPTVTAVHPRSLPGQVHPDAREAATARWRVVSAWLGVAVAVRVGAVAAAVLVAVVAVLRGYGPTAAVGGAISLAVGVVSFLPDRRRGTGDPRATQRWVRVALGNGYVAAFGVISAGFPVLLVLPRAVSPVALLALGAAGVAGVVWPTTRAVRSLLEPSCPEIGGTELSLQVAARTDAGRAGSRTAVVLTADAVLVQAAGGTSIAPNAVTEVSHPLPEITAVTVRQTVPDEAPWVQLRDGRQLHPAPGDVIQLDLADGSSAVLPVDHAAAFAAVLRYRVWARTGVAPADRAALRAPTTPHGGFPPEVLPAPAPVGLPCRAVPAPPAHVPTGAGRWTGWALGAAAVVVLPGALVLLQLSLSAGRVLSRRGYLPADTPVRAGGVAAVGVAVCALGWLVTRSWTRGWPLWALASAAGAAVLTTMGTQEVATTGPAGIVLRWWPVLGLLTVIACPLLARLGAAVLRRPTAWRARSSVQLRVPLGHGGELLVEAHRVVLAPSYPYPGGGNKRQAIDLAELVVVQAGTVAEPGLRWPVPGGRVVDVAPGTALRLVGGGQQWVLGVTDPEPLAAVLRARADGATPRRVTLETDAWRHEQVRATAITSGISWRSIPYDIRTRPVQNTSWRWVCLGAAGTAFVSVVVAISVAAAGSVSDLVAHSWLLLGFLPGLASILWGARTDRRLRPAEDNPLPAGSPPWGDQRADHAPVPGWQPWGTGADGR